VAVGFAGPAAFRAWLRKRHATARELLVRCFKTHASHRGLTYRQALDEALCFGWIDGVRRSLDEVSFSVRFSPRKPRSEWSTVNLRRFEELRAEGRVHAVGLAAFRARVKSRYSYESRPKALSGPYLREFRANERAWRFFESQPPWYWRTTAFWVMSAKRPETRARRLAQLIASSERGRAIPALGGRAKRAP
jgi:uncharacterized protein YdeI (YjbR/CyaY-like superfamily)